MEYMNPSCRHTQVGGSPYKLHRGYKTGTKKFCLGSLLILPSAGLLVFIWLLIPAITGFIRKEKNSRDAAGENLTMKINPPTRNARFVFGIRVFVPSPN